METARASVIDDRVRPDDTRRTTSRSRSRSHSREQPPSDNNRRSSWSRPLSWTERAFPLLSPEPGDEKSRPWGSAASHISDESHHDPEKEDAIVAASEHSAEQSGGEAGNDVEKTATEGDEAPPGPMDPRSYPDGGAKAWLAVLGGFCCLFVSFGWINAIGVFQEVYQTSILRGYDPSTVAWIVALETYFMFFGGPFMGLFFDNFGPRPLLLVGTFLHVFGLMMASISTRYWHFILAQGIASPLGASAVFYGAMSSVVTWFFKRRGLALGIMASGSSLGGVIFPIMVQQLIPKIGFPWAMRTAAFTILGMLVIANLTVRSRLTPYRRPFDPLAFIRPLAEPKFVILAISSFLIFFGLFIPFNFLPVQALQVGMNPTLNQYIIPILNAASIFGRITPGWLSDKVGRFNTTISMCGLCGVLVLALWLPATAPVPVIVFAALYGFGSGAFVSLVPALVATITPDMRQIGTRNGTIFAAVSIAALCGNPIAGALVNQDHGGYSRLKIFSGVFICTGSLILLTLRVILSKGRVFTKI